MVLKETPFLAVLRQELLAQHLRLFAQVMHDEGYNTTEKTGVVYPENKEASVSVKLCHNEGLLIGLRAIHTRMLLEFQAYDPNSEIISGDCDFGGMDLANGIEDLGMDRMKIQTIIENMGVALQQLNGVLHLASEYESGLKLPSSVRLVKSRDAQQLHTLEYRCPQPLVEKFLIPARDKYKEVVDLLVPRTMRPQTESIPLYERSFDKLRRQAEFHPEILVHNTTYEKLKLMWRRVNPGGSDEEFHKDLYNMITRYETTDSYIPKYQNMLPPAYYEALKELGVTTELMSCPINNVLPLYYSKHPSVDKQFGSLGELYNSYEPGSTTYHCNPSCSEDVMASLVVFVEEQLSRAEDNNTPLTFILTVPHRPGIDYHADLEASPYCNSKHNIPLSRNIYLSGMLNRQPRKVVKFKYSTDIYVLTNTKGYEDLIERCMKLKVPRKPETLARYLSTKCYV